MRKLVFVHDGPAFYDNNNKYYEFAYHDLLQRYHYLADEIVFLMRTKPLESSKKYTLIPEEITIVSVPNYKSPKTYFTNKKKADLIVKKCIIDCDIAVLRLPSSIAQIAERYLRELKKPYIIESVGCPWDAYWNQGILGKIVAPYMFLSNRKMIKRGKYVSYVTESFLQRRYPTNGNTVSCSNVVLDSVDAIALQNRIERIKNYDPQKRMILGTAAALDTRYKGHEYVIKAMPELISRGYNVEYWLAGGYTGSHKDTYLQDLVKEYKLEKRVKFLGSLSSKEMPTFYDSLDIYVQPSKQEGLPRAVIEAMSRACPVIGTNVAGIPELINQNCLFKKGSSKAIIDALILVNGLDLIEIAETNFERSKKYVKEKLVEKRKQFYNIFIENELQGEKRTD